MVEPRLSYLFQAYFNKTATSIEREELFKQIILSENDDDIKSLIQQNWESFNENNQLFNEMQYNRMLSNILKIGSTQNPAPVIPAYRRLFRWTQTAVAAAIVFLVIIGAVLWFKSTQTIKPIVQIKKEVKNNKDRILPGGDRAVLTLSDGSHITLDSTNQGPLANQGNTKVIKLNEATVAYHQDNPGDQKIVYNTLSTPRGGQYKLVMSDGTKVWLNASSSIRFPIVFKGKERDITMTGEAYFEVAKNASMPFKVKVNNMEVRVLGTHFNIMAYDDEKSISTTLLKGSVNISYGSLLKKLTPGQESMLDKSGMIKVVNANIDEVMAWKNGWFQFNSLSINEIMREVSRWYNVDVVYEGKIPEGHFSGIVSRSNDINQVLKIMEAGGVKFKIEGKKVIVFA